MPDRISTLVRLSFLKLSVVRFPRITVSVPAPPSTDTVTSVAADTSILSLPAPALIVEAIPTLIVSIPAPVSTVTPLVFTVTVSSLAPLIVRFFRPETLSVLMSDVLILASLRSRLIVLTLDTPDRVKLSVSSLPFTFRFRVSP